MNSLGFHTITRLLLSLFLLAIGYVLMPQWAHAEDRSYRDNVPLQPTNWNKRLSIPLFDPALGVLTKIEFVLAGQVNGNARLENLDAAPATVTAESVADLQLQRPDGTFIVRASPRAARSRQLGPFDNMLDYAGTSGVIINDIVGIDVSERVIYTNGADLQLFTGIGTIELGIRSTGRSQATGAGNLALGFSTAAGAAVTVTYTIAQPAIDLEKATNGQDADQLPGPIIYPGDTVTWTYVVTNIGEVPLVDLTLVDDREGDIIINCPQDHLAIAESMLCSLSGIAQQGSYTNTATVIGNVPSTLPGEPRKVTDTDPSHYTAIGDPAIDLEKLTNGEDADTLPGPLVAAGDTITWSYLVRNVGEIDLEAIQLFDDREGDLTTNCPQSTLAVSEQMICTVTGIAQHGQYTNTAVVTGTTPIDSVRPSLPVTDTDPSHYFGIGDPAIDLEKLTNGENADLLPGPQVAAGDVVTWSYILRNIGEIELEAITLLDDREGDMTTNCPQTTLAVGQSMVCTAVGIAQQGQYTNTAFVTGTTPADSVQPNRPVTDTDPSHYFGIGDPAIDLEKLTNGEDADQVPGPVLAPGAVVTWTYLVHNIGEIDLEAITLIDDREGDMTANCPQRTLAVGQSMICTAVGIAQDGQYTNTAIVTGTTPTDSIRPNLIVTDTDPSHYYAVGDPAIDLEKWTNGEDADILPGPLVTAGEPITWSYIVRNVGALALEAITLVDDREGDVTAYCPQTTLAVGESMRCTVNGIAQLGQYTNTAVVTGTTPADTVHPAIVVRDEDPSHYFGTSIAVCPVDQNGATILPALRYLGEGPGEYRLANPEEQFVIKKLDPFHFTNQRNSLYVSTRKIWAPERVWSCLGECTFTRGWDEVIDLGRLPSDTTLHVLIIDDDDDERINTIFADDEINQPLLRITEQSFTESVSVVLPHIAEWHIDVADSIGIYFCVAP